MAQADEDLSCFVTSATSLIEQYKNSSVFEERKKGLLFALILVILDDEVAELTNWILPHAEAIIEMMGPFLDEGKCCTQQAASDLLYNEQLVARASQSAKSFMIKFTKTESFKEKPFIYIKGLAMVQSLEKMKPWETVDYSSPQFWGLPDKMDKQLQNSVKNVDLEDLMLFSKAYPLLKLSLLRLLPLSLLKELILSDGIVHQLFNQTEILLAIALCFKKPSDQMATFDLLERYLDLPTTSPDDFQNDDLLLVLNQIADCVNLHVEAWFADKEFQLGLKFLNLMVKFGAKLNPDSRRPYLVKCTVRVMKAFTPSTKMVQLSELYQVVNLLDAGLAAKIKDNFLRALDCRYVTDDLMEFYLNMGDSLNPEFRSAFDLKMLDLAADPDSHGGVFESLKKFGKSVLSYAGITRSANLQSRKIVSVYFKLLESSLKHQEVYTEIENAKFALNSEIFAVILKFDDKIKDQIFNADEKMTILKMCTAYTSFIESVRSQAIQISDLQELKGLKEERFIIPIANYPKEIILKDVRKHLSKVNNFKIKTATISKFYLGFDGKCLMDIRCLASKYPSNEAVSKMSVKQVYEHTFPSRANEIETFLEHRDSRLFMSCLENHLQQELDTFEDIEDSEDLVLETILDKIIDPALQDFYDLIDTIKTQRITMTDLNQVQANLEKYSVNLSDELKIIENLVTDFTWRNEFEAKVHHLNSLKKLTNCAKIIEDVCSALHIESRFPEIENILKCCTDNETFGSETLESIETSDMQAGELLSGIAEQEMKALATMEKCKSFIYWIKETMKTMREFKVIYFSCSEVRVLQQFQKGFI